MLIAALPSPTAITSMSFNLKLLLSYFRSNFSWTKHLSNCKHLLVCFLAQMSSLLFPKYCSHDLAERLQRCTWQKFLQEGVCMRFKYHTICMNIYIDITHHGNVCNNACCAHIAVLTYNLMGTTCDSFLTSHIAYANTLADAHADHMQRIINDQRFLQNRV